MKHQTKAYGTKHNNSNNLHPVLFLPDSEIVLTNTVVRLFNSAFL